MRRTSLPLLGVCSAVLVSVVGGDTPLPQDTTNNERSPFVVSTAKGQFAATWSADGGQYEGSFGQIFSGDFIRVVNFSIPYVTRVRTADAGSGILATCNRQKSADTFNSATKFFTGDSTAYAEEGNGAEFPALPYSSGTLFRTTFRVSGPVVVTNAANKVSFSVAGLTAFSGVATAPVTWKEPTGVVGTPTDVAVVARPSSGSLSAGGFHIIWMEQAVGGGATAVKSRSFSEAGDEDTELRTLAADGGYATGLSAAAVDVNNYLLVYPKAQGSGGRAQVSVVATVMSFNTGTPAPVVAEFMVSPSPAGAGDDQIAHRSSVVALADPGAFLISWESVAADGTSSIFGRVYRVAVGAGSALEAKPLVDAFRLSDAVSGNQTEVSAAPAGESGMSFAAVWAAKDTDGTAGVMGKYFATPPGLETPAPPTTSPTTAAPTPPTPGPPTPAPATPAPGGGSSDAPATPTPPATPLPPGVTLAPVTPQPAGATAAPTPSPDDATDAPEPSPTNTTIPEDTPAPRGAADDDSSGSSTAIVIVVVVVVVLLLGAGAAFMVVNRKQKASFSPGFSEDPQPAAAGGDNTEMYYGLK